MESNKRVKLFFAAIIAIGVLITLVAPARATGDAAAGQAKAAVCAACHGTDGNSLSPEFPKIAGQVPGYVAAQLEAYKSGARQNAVMAGMVAALSEQDMLDLDAYYVQFETAKASISEDDVAAAERGRELYRIGSSQYSVPACMACHGPSGNGIPVRYPKVSAQWAPYLMQSLREFKSGVRVSEEMNLIAFRLTEQQIQDVSIYMQGLD